MGKLQQSVFNSIAELSAHIEADDHAAARRRDNSESIDYDAAMTSEAARECAASGGYWPEGAKNIAPITLNVDSLNASDLAIKLPEPAICGYRANVPAFLCGAPKAMMRMAPNVRPNRLLRIGVQVGKAWSVDQSQTFNRGNAILSVLNALHELGFAIELWAVERTYEGNRKTTLISNEVCIKRSTDSYSPDSIAFALCNDAFQRRLSWRVSEMQQESNKYIKRILDDCYGKGTGADLSDFDISFEYTLNKRYWNDKKHALDHIVESTKNQLDKLRSL